MFITRELDYSLRIIRALTHDPMLTAGEISRKEAMPPAITYKLLKQLTRAGIVISRRGAEGGYQLGMDCSDLTLRGLFEKMGVDLLVNRCQQPGYICENKDCRFCSMHREFDRIQEVLLQELDRRKLVEIL